MRADRLLSIVMLLQARGQLTAAQLAEELEVSQRTICRDMDALSIAGVPVYGIQGRGGGYALLDSYRTTLTGLTEGEVRALFMLSVPAPLKDLGVGEDLKSAMLKMAAALPGARQADEARVRQRVHLDSTPGPAGLQGDESLPHLRAIHEAVWQDRRISIQWRAPFGPSYPIEQVVDPYGLVAQDGLWHLVCAAESRVFVRRVSRLLDARMLDERFERPADFDLAAFWQAWRAEFEASRPTYPVRARVAPHLISELLRVFGEEIHERIARASPPDPEGWITAELPFESLWTARERLLGFGGAIEVLEPEPLRLSLIDYAQQILKRYKASDLSADSRA
jgi:predicted DNA-binding transcriptional regulator YafY